ncbi:hypothetical protein [Amycolatopsis sp. lyj-108]|uniref:hypothetical protein n=1 Tax=Amycolatopsis sp. lyj-108 TaxID=2789286 RepID=UPI00397AD518
MTATEGPDGTWRDRTGRRPSVMADHPGWWLDGEGRWRRLLRGGSGAVWLAVATPLPDSGHDIDLDLVDGRPGSEPEVEVEVSDPATLANQGSALSQQLLAAGPVARIRTDGLWEALVGAILRCTMPLEHARTVYRDASKALGQGHDSAMGREWLFPGPTTVLELSADVFDVHGLGAVRDRLRTAAWITRAVEPGWRTAAWDGLRTVLAPVPRIGSLIADVAVADLSGDFRFLAPSDFLVRRCVHVLDPATFWPDDAAGFGVRWQEMTGVQRSAWTVLVLARETATLTSRRDTRPRGRTGAGTLRAETGLGT